MPNQYHAVSEGSIANDVEAIIINRIQDVIGIYARACKLSNYNFRLLFLFLGVRCQCSVQPLA
jgi:hypothetical protein